MIIPKDYEELAEIVKSEGKHVFFFTAGWCPDCTFIKPKMPELEAEFANFKFVEVDRDQFMDLAIEWGIMGIPSFITLENGRETGRLVNKLRKTKEEVSEFLKGVE